MSRCFISPASRGITAPSTRSASRICGQDGGRDGPRAPRRAVQPPQRQRRDSRNGVRDDARRTYTAATRWGSCRGRCGTSRRSRSPSRRRWVLTISRRFRWSCRGGACWAGHRRVCAPHAAKADGRSWQAVAHDAGTTQIAGQPTGRAGRQSRLTARRSCGRQTCALSRSPATPAPARQPTAPTRPAVVLDPFGGTGTTALVAAAYGRHGITVDMSADYCRLAAWRTTDPGQLASALQVAKPPPVMDGQATFDDLLA